MESTMSQATSSNCQKRAFNFTNEDKHQLAKEVQKWSRIWDISSGLHADKNAVDQAWTHISTAVEKSVSECKAAWTSMQESFRYHAKASAAKGKSGSSGGESLDEPAFPDTVDWEFAEVMSFLPNVSQKRRTFTSPEIDEESTSLGNASDSQYDYTPKRSRPAAYSELWSKFDQLVDRQQKIIDVRQAAATESPFKGAFAAFEWLLQQLPRSTADECCLEFTNSLLLKVQQYKSSK